MIYRVVSTAVACDFRQELGPQLPWDPVFEVIRAEPLQPVRKNQTAVCKSAKGLTHQVHSSRQSGIVDRLTLLA